MRSELCPSSAAHYSIVATVHVSSVAPFPNLGPCHCDRCTEHLLPALTNTMEMSQESLYIFSSGSQFQDVIRPTLLVITIGSASSWGEDIRYPCMRNSAFVSEFYSSTIGVRTFNVPVQERPMPNLSMTVQHALMSNERSPT